jgi:hypothetical protein
LVSGPVARQNVRGRMSQWRDLKSGRDVWVLDAESARDWPAQTPWTCAGFGLLFAADHVIDVTRLGQTALAQGLAFAASWGSGCSLMEESFDEIIVGFGREETRDDVVLTTSHDGESLDEAIEFFLEAATASPARAPSCNAWVIFPLGAELRTRVERALRRRGAVLAK